MTTTVSAGTTSSGLQATPGNNVVVQNGGTASATTVSSGGEQDVSGTANSTLVSSGGLEVVLTGGAASGTTVQGGGLQVVSAGGNAAAATLSGTGAEQDVSGTATGTSVGSGGIEIVTAGGTATAAVVSSGGTLELFGGATATGTLIASGGTLAIASGYVETGYAPAAGVTLAVLSNGTAVNTVVGSGGTLELFGGAVATGTTITTGGTLAIASGYVQQNDTVAAGVTLAVVSSGLATGTLVANGGRAVVSAGGTTSGTVVSSGGLGIVSAGGTASSTAIRSGGEQDVSGRAVSASVAAGGREIVLSGGTASGTIVSSGGFGLVSAGGTTSNTAVLGGGEQDVAGVASGTSVAGSARLVVLAGGSAVGAAVASGGRAIVSAGGSATATAIAGGGEQDVSGLALSASVAAGGREVVLSGGTASGTVVSSGGLGIVSAGGTASTTSVLAGGEQDVSGTTSGAVVAAGGMVSVLSGGAARGVSLAGGRANVAAGGAASATTVLGGGVQDVYGSASGTVVSSGGQEVVEVGGTARGAQVVGGGQQAVYGSSFVTSVSSAGVVDVFSGGATSGTVIGFAGAEAVSAGGVASASLVSSGGQETVSSGGQSLSATVTSGGQQFVMSGGTANGATVAGGKQYVLSAGVTGTTITDGIQQIAASGAATSTTITGGTQDVGPGGVATSTTVRGGTQTVEGYASAFATVVSSGGIAVVGGLASGTVVGSGGVVSVTSGGVVFGSGASTMALAGGLALATVVSGGQVIVAASGTTSGTTVVSGGGETVSSAGSAAGTTVSSGGVQTVSAGGTASNTLVAGGGQLLVSSGGVASASVVNGGQETVSSGGTAVDAVISSGRLVLQAGAITSGGVTFGTAGTLEVDQAVPSGTQAFATPLSGFAVGDAIDLVGLDYVGGQTTAVISGAILTVSNGSGTETFQLADLKVGAFTAAADANGHVLLTGIAAPAISGTAATAFRTTSEAAVSPFTGVTVSDSNAGATETLTIALSGGGGTIQGLTANPDGTYTLVGSAAQVTAALRSLGFTPAVGAPDTSATTIVTLTDASSAGTTATDARTTVIDTDPAVSPTITGVAPGQTTTNDAAVLPFAGVTVGDRNGGATDTLTIALTGGGGTLSGTGLAQNPDGSYRLTGTAGAITTALRALSFTPAPGDPDTVATTTFTLTDVSTAGFTATDGATTVIDTDPAVAPTISGTSAGQATAEGASINPFGNVVLGDRNSQAADTLTITLTGAGGSLSGRNLTANPDGTYTLNGTAAMVTAALQSLTFTPPPAAADTSTTTGFTLSDASSAGTVVSDTTTTVVDTYGVVAPTIRGTAAGQATTREAPVSPFSGVTISDLNGGATETLTISLSGGRGVLSGQGLLAGPNGTYTLSGTAAGVTRALQQLSFIPAAGTPNSSTTTAFTLTDASSAGLTATDTRTTVVDIDPGISPVIAGTVAGQTTTADAPVAPFTGVVVTDANLNATDTLTLTLTGGGTLADGQGFNGLSGSNGTYVIQADTAANVTRELNALVFTPTPGVPATSSTTSVRIDAASSSGSSASDSRTTVIDSAPAVAPTISGTGARQTGSDQNPVTPFAGVTIADRNGGAIDTVTVTLAGGGTLADGQGYAGLTSSGDTYTLRADTAANVTRELDALVFTPAAGTPSTTATTTFTIRDASSAGTSASDGQTSVLVRTGAVAPSVTGTAAGQQTAQGAAISPFAGVTVADRNPGATEALTIALSGAGGRLTGAGLVANADGTYRLVGTAAAISTELRALVFAPAPGAAATVTTTSFTLTDASSAGTSAVDARTTVTDTEAAVRPTISGTVAGQRMVSEVELRPFAATVVADGSAGATQAVTLTLTGGGTLSDGQGFNGLSGSGGRYAIRAGTAAEVTRELQALVFTAAAGVPNTSSTTAVTLTDTSSTGLVATDGRTTLTDVDPALAPTIVGTAAGQTTSAEGPVSPFAGVTVTDANGGATDTLTISLSGSGGTLSGAGLTANPDGTYALSGTAATLSSTLQALSFTPAAGAPNTATTTGFTLAVASSAGPTASDARTSVVNADPPVAPTIANTTAGQATSDEATVTPFAGVVVSDANADATETLTVTPSGGGGTLTGDGLTAQPDGTFTLSGTAAMVTADLQALRFTAAAGAYGTSSTTTFALGDVSSAGPEARDSVTTVTDRVTRIPDAVTVDPDVTFLGHGRFAMSGRAYSASGIAAVAVSALIDDQRVDLGPATLAGDGSFTFVDTVGADPQTFVFTAQIANDGGELTADTHFALTAGIRGEPYVALQDRYDPATSAFIGQTFFASDGQVVYTSSYADNGDGTASYTYSGGTYFDLQSFGSYTATYDAAGGLLQLVRYENDGSHHIEIDTPGQAVASKDTDLFLNGGQTDTRFVFTPGFGHDVVRGFAVAGAGHDVLDLPNSDFTGIADVLRHTHNAANGTVIHDPTSGDTIRLTGVTKAQLARNPQDFAFHA